MDEEELHAEVVAHQAKMKRLRDVEMQARDALLRRAHEEGMRIVDIMRATGYSRETVRQAIKPEAKAASRAAVIKRRQESRPPTWTRPTTPRPE
jgi:hypothetical protein